MNPGTEFVLASEMRKINHLPPFAAIAPERLAALLMRCSIVFFRRGSLVFHPAIALPQRCFWIVREGRVRATESARAEGGLNGERHLETGAVFPTEVVLDRGGGWRVYAADEDCYLWRVEEEEIEQWLAEPAFVRSIALGLLDEQQRVRASAAELARGRQVADQALALPARSFAAAAAEYVAPSAPVSDVAALMAARKISSVLVGSPEAVAGIVTQSDLIFRAMAPKLGLETTASQVMTPSPKALEDTASVVEAGIEMAQSHRRHLLLRDSEGHVAGVVSERDILRAQLRGLADVFTPIDEANSVGELIELSHRTRDFAERVLVQGMEIGQFTRLVSSLNDRISRRLLVVLGADRKPAPPFCWIAFGSEAREEQGFVTDQDNGIVFDPREAAATEDERAALIRFARAANDALDACGFPRCKGNIMAGNPECCLSLAEWNRKFSSWIRSTTPEALLNATIFFDLRAVHGEERLVEAMLDHLLGEARENTLFLHQMASNALKIAPPIGRFSRFATASGQHAGTIDLKTQGSRLFVDVARVLALANKVRAANTVQRLRVVGQRTKRSLNAIEGDVAAFRLIQAARMRRQLDAQRGGGDPNRIDPYTLDELQQRILHESLRQAASLQERLRLNYQA